MKTNYNRVTKRAERRLYVVMKKNFLLVLLLTITAGTILSDVVVAQPRYKIGVCDWMILKRQKLGEFALAKELGCDGIEMDMGGLGNRNSFDNKMRDPRQANVFCRTADSLGIKVGAVAMSGFYGQNFAKKESWRWLIQDCLNTMNIMKADVAFLPLGGCGNGWTDSIELRQQIVWRLHEAGEMAKKRGKVIGIDTPLDANGNIKLLNEIGSDGIKIFYKLQTAIENKRDAAKEIKLLGRNRICAIHASNTDGVWLRNDKAVKMKKIKKALDTIEWHGWLFIERSRDVNDVRNVKKNYSENVKYLKEILQ